MSGRDEQNELQEAGDEWPAWLKSPIFNIAVGVFVALAIAVGAFYLVSKHIEHHQPAFKPSQGLTLTPPPQWTRVRPAPKGSAVAYTAPAIDTDTTGKLTPYLAVEDYTLSSTGKKATFQKLEGDFESQLSHDYSSYTQLASSSTTIKNSPALLLTFSYVQNQAAVTSQSLLVVKHGILYDAHGNSLTSTWPQHSKAIQRSLLSLQP